MLLSMEVSVLIPRLMAAANRRLREARLDGDDRSLDRRWVKQWISRQQDLDWESESVLAEMEENIGDDAIKLYRRRGYEPRPARGDSNPRGLAPSSVGRAYATAAQVRSLAEDARLSIWGKRTPPFKFTKAGADEAREWFLYQDMTVRNAGLESYPAMLKLELFLEAPDVRDWSSELIRAEGANRLAALVKLLAAHPQSLRLFRENGGHNGGYLPSLEVTQANGLPRQYLAPAGTVLGQLHSHVTAIAKASSWWSTREATDYVCFGKIPSASVRVTTKRTWAREEELTEIVLTIRGPTTHAEVAEAYEQVLEENGLQAYKLSDVHNAVLQLVHTTPTLSWSQRYKRWLEWCKHYPHLPDFNSNSRSGPPSLCNTYKRALRRTGWQRVD